MSGSLDLGGPGRALFDPYVTCYSELIARVKIDAEVYF